MKQLKNQRGLTLIELLAVVVILAIIAAIAAVAIGNVINNSKDKAALSDAVMILEGAKLANLDDACTDTNGTIECKKADLKNFLGSDLDEYYTNAAPEPVAQFIPEGANGGEWQLAQTKQMSVIRNEKYKPKALGEEGKMISESDIKGALKGDDK